MKRMEYLHNKNFLLALLALEFILLANVWDSSAQTTQSYTIAGSYNFTVPAGVTSVTVKAWGGGGGGGYSNSGNSNQSAGGGGGGGGGYRTGTFSVTGGQTITITVGNGGSGANADGKPGIAGENSTVTCSGNSIVANGGGAGNAGINNTTGGTGGIGGGGSGGTGGYSGANGTQGGTKVGGPGGGGAGDGANASGSTGGTNSGGNGGSGGASGIKGSNGNTIGGGGGGTGDNANPPVVGGSGARGEVRISYTCTTYSITGISGTNACVSSGTSTITVTSTPAGLPVGMYTVTYDRSAPAATGLTAAMTVTTAGTGTFTAIGLTSAGTPTITVKNLASGSNGVNLLCSNSINTNNVATITVSSAPSQPSVITGNTTPCEGSEQTYSVTNVPGVTYSWVLPAGWTQTGVGNSNSIQVIVGSSSGNIQVTPSNGCVTGPAQTLATTVTSINILGFPGSRCGAGTGVITLSATASSGTIKWYDSNGNYLSSGSTYVTPVLNTTTTYYAESTNATCTSARIPVTAYIITPPSLTASGGGTYCYGTNVNLNSTLSGADNVYWEGPNGYYSVLEDPVLSAVTPSMSGTYTVNSNALSGINLITNGDFEMGNIGFSSAYTNNSSLQAEGTYAVVANPNTVHTGFTNCADHSSTGTLQMVVNGAVTSGVTVWSQTVNVVPNTYYQFTYWVQSVVGNNPSELQLYINGVSAGPIYTALTATCNWSQFLYNWSSGSNTSAVLELKNRNIIAGGNDFALDDIVFQHTCTSFATVNVTVNSDVTAGNIGSNQSICYGNTPSKLTSSVAGTGSGTISYEWESNASGSYVTIPGAVAADYTPSALNATTNFRRRTVSNSGGATCYSGYTNIVTVTVSGPTVNAGGPNTVCQSGSPSAIILTGASYGGLATSAAWSIVPPGGGTLSTTAQTTTPATVTYTPQANYSGTVILRLTTSTSPCSATSDRTLTIVPSATAVAGTVITTCSNSGPVNITTGSSATNYTSVTWSSNGTGIFTNTNSLTLATYSPSAADIAAGSITLTLTANGNSPCGNAVSTKTLTITPLPSATISYTGSPYCKSGSTAQGVTRTGTAGGIYSASPAGLSIDTSTGAITPNASTAGTYTVTYTMAAAGSCSTQTATATVTISDLPTATITYTGSPYCSSLNDPQPVTRTGTSGGSYSSSPSGLSIDPVSGAITPSGSTPRTYTVTYTMAAAGGCTTQTSTTLVTILPDGSWTGASDREWNNPGNWACNQLPTLTTNVTIASGLLNYPKVSTAPAGMARNIYIASGASVTVEGGTLQIAGNISNSGTFTATQGTIEMKGSAAQTIGANVFATNTLMNLIVNNTSGVTLQGALNITGAVSPVIGNLSAGGYLNLLSTAGPTALIDGSGSGNVTGNVNMQRYLPSSFGYKYFSSPFQSATVAELADEVNLTETFPTFFKYDEDHSRDSLGITVYYTGWTKYTTATNPLVPLYGYAANLGTGTNPVTVTMSGVVNNGAINTTLYNNNRKYTKGFNLVGNPYPSPIDWNAPGWTKTNVDDAIYFFNAGNTDRYTGVYSSYVNGVSSDINTTHVIAAMQGFFVHVSNGTYPVTATLGVSNAVRINNLNPVFKAAMIDPRPTLRLKAGFEIKDAIEDAAVVYFDPMAGNGFEQDKDALKLNNTDLLVPNIYTLSPQGRELSINGLSMASDSLTSILVGITTFTSGWVNLRAENVKDLDVFEQLILKDALTGQLHDLRLSPNVRFYLDKGKYDRRFSLLFSKEPVNGGNAAVEKLFTVVRSANTVLVKVNLAANTKGTLIVTNLLGQAILKKEVFEKQTVEISEETGVYVITLVSGKITASEKILMRTDYE